MLLVVPLESRLPSPASPRREMSNDAEIAALDPPGIVPDVQPAAVQRHGRPWARQIAAFSHETGMPNKGESESAIWHWPSRPVETPLVGTQLYLVGACAYTTPLAPPAPPAPSLPASSAPVPPAPALPLVPASAELGLVRELCWRSHQGFQGSERSLVNLLWR